MHSQFHCNKIIIFNKQRYWQMLGRIMSQTLIVLACINLMVISCRKLLLLLWERKTFTCVKSISKIQKPIQKLIANSSQKLISEHSVQTIFKTIIREIIRNVYSYKLLTEKSFQTLLSNYYQSIISNKMFLLQLFLLLCERKTFTCVKSIAKFETSLLNYYQRVIAKSYT